MATYFIRQGTFAPQGPFEEARVVGYIAQGKLRAGMEISADGQRWMPVEEHRLFASAAPAAPTVRAPSRPPQVRAPQPVEEVEEIGEVLDDEDPRPRHPRPRRALRPAAPEAHLTQQQKTGIGCGGLLAGVAILYFLGFFGGKVSDSLVGTWVNDGLKKALGTDDAIVFRADHTWAWYHRTNVDARWEEEKSGTWTSSEDHFSDTGERFEKVLLTDKDGTKWPPWARDGRALHRGKPGDDQDMRFRKDSDGTRRP